MKKLLIKIIGMLLILATLAGCSEYNIVDENAGGSNSTDSDNSSGGTGSADTEGGNTFSVSIRYDGKAYVPKKSAEMKAKWTDGFSVYVADFGEDGVARVSGLDGDYQVTLVGLPDTYVYDPNAHVATNNKKDIVIDIYKPIRTSGYGVNAYDCIKINQIGVYRVEINSADHKVFFQYAPSESGTYSVESWVSVADENYNPMADVWIGSIAYKTFSYTLNDGGVSSVLGKPGGYTKNFKYIVEISEEMFSSNGGGQAVFTYAVRCDSKNGIYPTYVDIAVKLNGSFDNKRPAAEIIIPEEDFKQTPEYDKDIYKYVGAETSTVGVEGRYEFDGSMWRLFEHDEDINGDGIGDGDGYYHLYDETLYPENGGYGPILYVKITEACRFMDLSFTHIEDPGNKSLTVNGTENHKLLIQGIDALLHDLPGDAGMYFCLPECPCFRGHTCSEDCPDTCPEYDACIGFCPESCTECDKDCRKMPDFVFEDIYYCHGQCKCSPENGVACYDDCIECNEYCKRIPKGSDLELYTITADNGMTCFAPKYLIGYANFVNSDGVYAVTAELKHFLQSFSVTQRMFADGNGWVEENPTIKVDATEDDQWLFACGYYKPIK